MKLFPFFSLIVFSVFAASFSFGAVNGERGLHKELAAVSQQPFTDNYCESIKRYSVFSSRTYFVSPGMFLGPVELAQLGLGTILREKNYLMLSYNIGRQEYLGEYLVPMCRDCHYVFHGLWLTAGREVFLLKKRYKAVYISPSIAIGFEAINARGLMEGHDTRLLYSPGLRPQLELGYMYQQIDFFVGIHYSHWLLEARTFEGKTLHGEPNGPPMRWGSDLFPGRKGTGLTTGIRVFFF